MNQKTAKKKKKKHMKTDAGLVMTANLCRAAALDHRARDSHESTVSTSHHVGLLTYSHDYTVSRNEVRRNSACVCMYVLKSARCRATTATPAITVHQLTWAAGPMLKNKLHGDSLVSWGTQAHTRQQCVTSRAAFSLCAFD